MWEHPDKEGQLRKKGHVVKNWKTRWFIIKNNVMYYFKARGDKKPKGYIPLRFSTAKLVDKKFIELDSPSIAKTFLIECDSETEAKEWMKAIEKGIFWDCNIVESK